MSTNALVQARIDAAIKERAAVVLEGVGLTVSDAVRILLTCIARDGSFPVGLLMDSTAHDVWFRAKVQEALEDTRPALQQEQVEAYFEERRANALLKHKESLS